MRFNDVHLGCVPFFLVRCLLLLLQNSAGTPGSISEESYIREGLKKIGFPKSSNDLPKLSESDEVYIQETLKKINVPSASDDLAKSRGSCKDIEFKSVPLGRTGKNAHYMVKPTAHSWFDAVCCCRSRGLILIGPTTTQELQDTYNATFAAGISGDGIGWVDYHGYSGVWKSLYSGNVASKQLLDPSVKAPKSGSCLELKPTKKFTNVFNDLGGDLKCNNTISVERFYCVDKDTHAHAPPDDCFGSSGECDIDSIIQYASTGSCSSENNELQERGDCQHIDFQSVPLGKKGDKGYYIKTPIAVTWFQAVCCCRSRGLVLSSPTTSEELRDLYIAGEAAGIKYGTVGWVDYHSYSGEWKSLNYGNVASKDLLDINTIAKPKKAMCLELKPFNGSYVLFDYGEQLGCNSTYKEQFFCVEKKGSEPPSGCFGTSAECDVTSIVHYAETGTCAAPKNVEHRGDCQHLNFDSVPIGNNGRKAHYMKTPTPMTWFEAVCCCRSRGLILSGPTTSQQMKDLYKAGEDAGFGRGRVGWVDYHGFSGGVWKSLHSGNVATKGILHPLINSTKKGVCLELKPKNNNYFLYDFGGNLQCNEVYTEPFFCVEKTGLEPPVDCFGYSKSTGEYECDAKSIIHFAESGICPMPSVNISDPCQRNCQQKGRCTAFQRCAAKNDKWEWDRKSESYIGEWQTFACPGGLYWNSNHSAMGSCDFFGNLLPETQKLYREVCGSKCSLQVHEEKDDRCGGKFWFYGINSTRVLKECPKGLIFSPLIRTCTKCADTDDATRLECCPSSSKTENRTKSFTFKFETDKFGLDVYLLMDGTRTFNTGRQHLLNESTKFTKSLQTLSTDVYLGFGIFIDKAGLPQDAIIKREIYESTVSYGLWNKMPLTNQLERFAENIGQVLDPQVSGQREDALTGLHQSAVCVSEIGWRQKTRRFILLTTDQLYYEEGDKTHGPDNTTKVRLFDGKCHLDQHRIYNGSEYDYVDYPSLDQVKLQLLDKSITVIFAIGQAPDAPKNILVIDKYREIAPGISPTPLVYPLKTNSSTFTEDIIEIIKKAYDEGGKSIPILTKLSGPVDNIKNVIVTTKCNIGTIKVLKSDGSISEECSTSSSGEVEYEVTVTLPCPWTNTNVKLSSIAFGTDERIVDLVSVCPSATATTPKPTPTTQIVPVFKTGTSIVNFTLSSFGFDLYYLMDATGTFAPDRFALAQNSEKFYASLRELSSDFQLGFGLFGDKEPLHITYGLYNKMPLTKDTSGFKGHLDNTQNVNGGDGDPEDVFSALHQIAACTEKINWRKDTLRMLLVTTDELFQTPKNNIKAFDGSKCHLGANGKYEGPGYAEVDYPTLDDIRKVIKENTIRVIFAIKEIRKNTPPVPEIYKDLAEKLAPMPTVLPLEIDSKNIIKVIQDAYARATRDVAIETILSGPKSITNMTVIQSTCLTNVKNDDIDSVIIKENDCQVPKDGLVSVQINVTLPCHLETKNLKLTVHIQGHSKLEPIDLTKICN